MKWVHDFLWHTHEVNIVCHHLNQSSSTTWPGIAGRFCSQEAAQQPSPSAAHRPASPPAATSARTEDLNQLSLLWIDLASEASRMFEVIRFFYWNFYYTVEVQVITTVLALHIRWSHNCWLTKLENPAQCWQKKRNDSMTKCQWLSTAWFLDPPGAWSKLKPVSWRCWSHHKWWIPRVWAPNWCRQSNPWPLRIKRRLRTLELWQIRHFVGLLRF